MGTFRYVALTAAGARVSGELEAADAAEAAASVRRAGHYPLRTRPARPGPLGGLVAALKRRGSGGQPLAVATHELATLLTAGLSLDAALDLVARIAGDRRLAAGFATVCDRVRGGASLAQALEAAPDSFPRLYVTLVRAGEGSGGLDAALARVAEYLQRSHAVREQVKSALVYPAILVVTAGLALTFVLTYVLPQFAPLFAGAGQALPLPTRIVMGVADAVGRWGWLGVLVGAASVLGLRRALRRPAFRRRWDARLLRLPILGPLVTEIEAARFARTLGTLLKSGMTLPTALGFARETIGNAAMAAAIGDATGSLRAGSSLSPLLARSGLFPALAAQLARVGEETGRLDEMLLHQAALFDRSAQRSIDRLLAALVPTLTISLGLMVAGIIASVMLAILKINDLAL